MEELYRKIVEWLQNHLKENQKEGFILGISGGVDSCVLTHLLHQSGIPYQSIHYLFDDNEVKGENPVISFLKKSTTLNIKLESLEEAFSACYNQICKEPEGEFASYLFKTILKSKLSHIDLGYKATKTNFVVLGTINLDEFILGYFVKNTCIGDLLPFASLPKKTIRKLGAYLGVPESITTLKASGCVYGTHAENEWGITEEEIYFLVTGQEEKVSTDKILKYQSFVAASKHKREFVPVFSIKSEFHE